MFVYVKFFSDASFASELSSAELWRSVELLKVSGEKREKDINRPKAGSKGSRRGGCRGRGS